MTRKEAVKDVITAIKDYRKLAIKQEVAPQIVKTLERLKATHYPNLAQFDFDKATCYRLLDHTGQSLKKGDPELEAWANLLRDKSSEVWCDKLLIAHSEGDWRVIVTIKA